MAGFLLASLLTVCAVLSRTLAANNESITDSVPKSLLEVLPHVSSPPILDATWPPFNKSESGDEFAPPKDFNPSGEYLSTDPSNEVSTVESNASSTTTLTSAPEMQPSTLETETMMTTTTTSLPSQSTKSSVSPSPSTTTSSRSTTASKFRTTVIKHNPNDFGKDSRRVSLAVFLVVPVCVGLLISFFILFGKYCRKKLRLDKLRHQLMPMYSFDPAEGEDWETELLTDPRTQTNQQSNSTQASTRSTGTTEVPQLRFTPPVADV